MLILLNVDWPWIVFGLLLVITGIAFVGVPPAQWLEFLLNLPFTLSADQTQTEKQETDRPIEDIAASNPGCGLIAAGLIVISYGVFRWLT